MVVSCPSLPAHVPVLHFPPNSDATEAEVFRGLRTQFRVIATPLPGGATRHEATWNDLYGSVIVWVGE